MFSSKVPRQQAQSHTQGQDENRFHVVKPLGGTAGTLASKGMANTSSAAQRKLVPMASTSGNVRRTLGDIGNVGVGLSQRQQINPAKGRDGLRRQENPAISKKVTAADRPATRSFGTQLGGRSTSDANQLQNTRLQQLADVDNHNNRIANKPKQAVSRRNPNPKLHLPPLVPIAKKSDNKPASVDHPSGTKAMPENNIKANKGALLTAKERRVKTLTATLTARSEAACRGFDYVKKVEAVDEVVPNIDEADIGNQLAVVDYVEDIYSFYRKAESQSCVAPDYMSRQTDINENMRAILIDWLIDVHSKFKLMPETLFLTTNLLDRYLSITNVARRNLQLVGLTAMLLAAKYEETWAPEIQDFTFISDNAYSREQFLDMEKIMLNTLRFNLTVPTPYVFLVRILKAASSDLSNKMNMLAFFLVELCLVDYKMVGYSPSLLAAAAVYTSNCKLSKTTPFWNASLIHHSGYTVPELLECAKLMAELHKNAKEGKLSAVQRKYSLPKYGDVATLLLPEEIPEYTPPNLC